MLFHARGFEYTLLSTTKGDLLINLKYAYQPVSLADAGGKYADAKLMTSNTSTRKDTLVFAKRKKVNSNC